MISYSVVASNNVATTTPTVTTGAFTPANGSLLVAIAPGFVPGSRTAPQSITDSAGLTWTQRVFREDPAGGTFPTVVAIWTAPVATGTSMTVTVNYGDPSATDGAGKQSIYVVEVAGHNSSSPVVQTFSDGNSGNPLNFSGAYNGTLSTAPASTSLVLAVASIDDDRPNGDSDIVTGTGWTQLAEDFAGNPYNTCQIQARTGSTSTSVAWNTLAAKWTYSVAAIEIAEASSSGINGTLNQTIGAVTLSASGSLPIKGQLSASLGEVSLAASADLIIQGSLSQTIDAVGLAASGAGTLPAINGSLNATIDPVTLFTGTPTRRGGDDAPPRRRVPAFVPEIRAPEPIEPAKGPVSEPEKPVQKRRVTRKAVKKALESVEIPEIFKPTVRKTQKWLPPTIEALDEAEFEAELEKLILEKALRDAEDDEEDILILMWAA